jgi:hypothetical protein
MVRPSPPISAATLAPTGNSPPGQELNQSHALDADHLRGLGPLAPAHVHFGVVDPKRLDLDDDMTDLRLRIGNLLVHEAVESSKLLHHDCTH